MRYLHDELLVTAPAKTIMRETDDEIRARGDRCDPGNPQVAETIVGLRHWLLDGRRVVLLSPLTVDALLESPETEAVFGPSRCIEVMLERPLPSRRGYHATGEGLGMLTEDGSGDALVFCGFFLRAVEGLGFLEVVQMHWDGRKSWASVTTGPDLWGTTGDLEAQIISATMRALSDERTAWIDPRPKRNRTQTRKDKKAGLNVGRLVLSEDALNVWRRRMLAERQAPAEKGEAAEGTTRAPCCPHEVRPHMCRTWVLDPGEDEVVLDMRPGRSRSHGEASGEDGAPWTASVLYCVSRPRAGHVRGAGEVVPRVERVVPCL